MKDLDFNITIVGLGLIGGSLAMALNELNPKNIWGIDIDNNTLNYAKSLEIIGEGYVNPKIPLSKSDIVIICLYPNDTIQFIKDNIEYFKDGAIITDTAGIKNKLVKEIGSFLPKDLEYIGGHPMAGKEYNGIKNATKDLFVDANYIITPTKYNSKINIKIIEDLAIMIGCKRVVKVSSEKHDEIIAYTSQLPHIIANALMNSDIEEDINLFEGGSFNDATRVANINISLWMELFMENKDNIIKSLDMFETSIKNIKDAIRNDDSKKLEKIFKQGNYKKELMVKRQDFSVKKRVGK